MEQEGDVNAQLLSSPDSDQQGLKLQQVDPKVRGDELETGNEFKIPKMMRAIPFTKNGKLNIKEVPCPLPDENEVLIKVHCFGLNFADVLARKGEYPDAPPFPFIPGYEVAGVIVALGKGVNNWSVGTRVAALVNFGGYAEYAVAKTIGMFELPQDMTFEIAASIPVAFVTAYYSIYMTGPVRAGDRILIHAAAGGVGLAAVQLAALADLQIFGTASSHKLKALTEEWGVNYAIDYRMTDFVEEITKINKCKKSMDIIVDSIGGSQLKRDQLILRPGGRIIGIGAAAMQDRSLYNALGLIGNVVSMVTMNSIEMLMNCTSLCGVNLKRLADDRPELVAHCLKNVINLFMEGKLRSYIFKVYPWEDITQAHSDIQSRITIGKLIIKIE